MDSKDSSAGRTVLSKVVGKENPAIAELVFENWSWSLASTPLVGGKRRNDLGSKSKLSPSMANDWIKKNDDGDLQIPLELRFQTEFDPPMMVWSTKDDKQLKFDPRGWTIHGTGTTHQDWNAFEGYFNVMSEEWLFSQNGKWLVISIERHVECNMPLGTTFRFLSPTEAANWSVEHGEIPSELEGLNETQSLTADYDDLEPETENNTADESEWWEGLPEPSEVPEANVIVQPKADATPLHIKESHVEFLTAAVELGAIDGVSISSGEIAVAAWGKGESCPRATRDSLKRKKLITVSNTGVSVTPPGQEIVSKQQGKQQTTDR